ncbi:MAG: NAD(P)/FAD-dependent oxidoreductase [Desulfobacteraceae bacterium]|nr:NAD(P)/FAD-dependent oxidoreductase [Desulfobacteraceae bacterium]
MVSLEQYDVVILGTGPAGLQAAIHAARKKVSVLVLGKEIKSSLFHAHIENYYSVFNMSGAQMLATGREQAASFGARFLEDDVLRITFTDGKFGITSESGRAIRAVSLIIATGTSRKRLNAPGEKEFLSKGVSYCVDCDGNFFRGETVAVIGNESAAADGALTLLGTAAEVHLVCDKLQVSDALREKIENSDIIVHEGADVNAIRGEKAVDKLEFTDGTIITVSGVFIELGAKGVMELATSLGIQLDADMKYIDTDKKQHTNISGAFAAGDVCGPPWQMAKAVGEGCVAGIEAAAYAKKNR